MFRVLSLSVIIIITVGENTNHYLIYISSVRKQKNVTMVIL